MYPRLEMALRAGKEREESGLTRTLKRTSLVPTGACLPRNFDPDYCAYDRYYTVGVALVSTTLGALLQSALPALGVLYKVADALQYKLGKLCHTPEPGWIFSDEWNGGQNSRFTGLCRALDTALVAAQVPSFTFFYAEHNTNKLPEDVNWRDYYGLTEMYEADMAQAKRNEAMGALGRALTIMLMRLDALARWPKMTQNLDRAFHRKNYDDEHDDLKGYLNSAWYFAFYKYLAYYMNEHAMMIASFFRVNAKLLHNNEPLRTDLRVFIHQCKEDIADGPNPPPPPPPAYEDFDPEAVAAERQRRDELRQRAEARDPLLEGIDYPETYASCDYLEYPETYASCD